MKGTKHLKAQLKYRQIQEAFKEKYNIQRKRIDEVCQEITKEFNENS
ncbi:hypothetical protein [Flammeovirga aprica]|uniref:Uncharacterized protein n=1 Tax=Flammeovirga aprica JL-4 TaxID=694437 RepID=A0A7X9NZN0_9BACT|nr:hypothetical protein [Flammeovirga aprica]NME66620.1 hypothetical protein [Flammeovirga aprica JL-4]